ncbi:MAG: M3 family oligoendopeptidase [Clostridiales bacterium]|nr:M3 family oligoendopeptidase [Clostridiales bacterium]
MKFSTIPYTRANIDEICRQYEKITEDLKNAADAEEVFSAILKHEKLLRNFSTMRALAYIRHSIDTTDSFYDKENSYYDEAEPRYQEASQRFMLTLINSTYQSAVAEKYGSLLFTNIELELKSFSPDIIPELTEENRLVSEYQKLIASAQIDFDGKMCNLSQLGAYKVNPDRALRRAAYEAEGKFYQSISDKLDMLFDDLVKIRTTMAKKLGYKSFTELGYLRRCRNCYGPEEVAAFRRQVIDDLVPIVTKIKEMQRERIGAPEGKLNLFDDPFIFAEGNPKPVGTPADILAAGKRMYEEMSPDTAKFINFMYQNELFDVEAKKGKAVGGYCTSLPDYNAPFIFSNFNGTSGDVDVLTHEAGHAFASYKSSNYELLELSSPTIEACEVHSMTMEFMAWPWLSLFYGKDAERARFAHLSSALVFIPYGCMVDHFQHIIYDNPSLTPEQRHEEWARLEKIYRPYLSLQSTPFYAEGRGWQRQLHIYHYPFYYIDYCLAQTVALKFFALSQKDYKDAWQRYLAFVNAGGTKTFVQLCMSARLPSPFERGSLSDVSRVVNDYLDEYNKKQSGFTRSGGKNG